MKHKTSKGKLDLSGPATIVGGYRPQNKLTEALEKGHPQQVRGDFEKKAGAPISLLERTAMLAKKRQEAADVITAALNDAQNAPVTEILFNWLKEQTKNFNLRLRLLDDGQGKQPAVRLTNFKDGTVIFSTIEREERKLSYDRWPGVNIFASSAGRGSNASPEISHQSRVAGGRARMAGLSEEERSDLGKLAAEKKWANLHTSS